MLKRYVRARSLAALAAGGLCLQAGANEAYGPQPTLPPPDTAHEVRNYPKQSAWPEGRAPAAPEGFVVTRYAQDLDSPRWLYVLDNGDVLVAESSTEPQAKEGVSQAEAEEQAMRKARQGQGQVRGKSADRITLLRDADADGRAEIRHVLLQGLNQPFGMLYLDGHLYVANTDGVVRFPFEPGQTRIDARPDEILQLPAGGYNNHWTRNLLASRDGSKIYVSVGSASNVAEHGMEHEIRRANILEIDPQGGGERVFASGLRNPNGMAWRPGSDELWTVVNERDHIGDGLVPDYLTRVRENGFYGWPYSYWGSHPDPRLKGEGKEQAAKAIVPDYALGNHTASLGLAFYTADAFPERYRGGAFIGQRGSWNSKTYTGYKVVFVPFADGRPAGQAEDFLTGFMPDRRTGVAYGRPVGVAVDGRGALLVADDTGNMVWRVAPRR